MQFSNGAMRLIHVFFHATDCILTILPIQYLWKYDLKKLSQSILNNS